MISNPKQGQKAYFWYAKKKVPFAEYHGMACRVIVPGKGKPRNHLVRTHMGDLVIVPAGNLILPDKFFRINQKKQRV